MAPRWITCARWPRKTVLLKKTGNAAIAATMRLPGITVQVEADLPIKDETFAPKFKQFEVHGPGSDLISIRHHFSLPDLKGQDLGQEVYRKPPWAIYRKGDSWIYLGISPEADDPTLAPSGGIQP